jgi:hypothetical protein
MTGEEEVLLDKRVTELREHEGLLADTMPLAFGYLCRGKPWDALHSLMAELFDLRATMGERRLQEEIALNREQPLLERRAAEKIAAEERARLDAETAAKASVAAAAGEDRRARLLRLAEKATAQVQAAEATRGISPINPNRQPRTFPKNEALRGAESMDTNQHGGTLNRPTIGHAEAQLVDMPDLAPISPETHEPPVTQHVFGEEAEDEALSASGDSGMDQTLSQNSDAQAGDRPANDNGKIDPSWDADWDVI